MNVGPLVGWMALVLVVGVFGTGCHPRYINLRDGLRPPSDLRPGMVRRDLQEEQKALQIYKSRRVKYERIASLYGHNKTMLMRGSAQRVHWKELLEEGGLAKEAKALFAHQRNLRVGVSLGMLFGGIGLGIGGGYLFHLLIQPGSGHDTGVVLAMAFSSVIMMSAGATAVVMSAFVPRWQFGVKPKQTQINRAMRTYNRRLRRALGLHEGTGPKPRQKTLPILLLTAQ